MYELKQNKTESYELDIIAAFCSVLTLLRRDIQNISKNRGEDTNPDFSLLRQMITFIYHEFQGTLSLDEIAQSANISRSKCCRLFQKYIDSSPVEFLNDYRLKISSDMLSDTDRKISDIAMECGFNSFSYYSAQFRKKYGTTPRQYRAMLRRQEEPYHSVM